MSSMVASVVIRQIKTADQKGEKPRYTMGRYHSRMEKKVKTSPIPPLIPCFPPTKTSTARYRRPKA